MRKTRVMTLRLTTEQADELEFVARVDEVPVSETIREAITAFIQARRVEPAFQQRLRERMESDQNILKRLGE